MTTEPTITDRFRRVAARFTEAVEAVPPDRWGSPAPCEGWDARNVVRHVVEAHGIFLGLVGREVDPAPSVDEDPVGAWAAARDAVQRDLDDPERAGVRFEGSFGPTTFEESISRFLVGDILVHTWDLARATGLDERLDPEELARMEKAMTGMPEDALRQPGVFGPAVEPPPGADDQTRILAFLGRRA